MRISFIFWLINLSLCSSCFAINNIENERLSLIDEGLSGQIQASVDGKNGNSDKESFEVGAKGIYKIDSHMVLLLGSREYGKSFDQTDTDNHFMHFRYVKQHRAFNATEFFLQSESNPFKRLTTRSLVGAGTRLTLYDEKKLKLILGSGAFFLREEIADENTEEFWRANFYFIYKHAINDQMNLLNTFYLQPVIDDVSDLEIFNDFSLNIKLTHSIKLTLSFKTTHDKRPPQGVARTDSAYSTSFLYAF
ncbi:MAG: DUF481 domain-containing protein [Pseudomonadales bacterium]|nr:DUF481 domain-containing protein [Pseudomonadales bacterium]